MKTKAASDIVQLALEHANALHKAKLEAIAAAAHKADGVSPQWLLDPSAGVWVLPDQPAPMPPGTARASAGSVEVNPKTGGENAQAPDATGHP